MDKTEWEQGMAVLARAHADEHPFGAGEATFGDITLKLAVAESTQQRARGMAGLSFDEFEAMLFVQPVEQASAFHMNGVDQELGLLCYDADCNLVAWRMLKPGREQVKVDKPFKYAIEMPLQRAIDAELYKVKLSLLLWGEAYEAQISPAGQQKKSDVNYRSGDGSEICMNCTHFLAPAGCELVAGDIQSTQVCDLIELRPLEE